MDRDFLKTRITKTKDLIDRIETAYDAIALDGMESYTIDTGQSRQTVTKSNLADLHRQLDSLYNRLATLEARLSGAGLTARPGW